jgi:diaminopimelate epimerase
VRGTIVYKMTGSGNDFVLLDGRSTSPKEWTAARISRLCDRRTGVGADGLVILAPDAAPGVVRMTYWNSDGSHAAMCGNAALCSARLSVYLELAPAGDLRLLTDAGLVRAHCRAAGDQAQIRLPDFEVVPEAGIEPEPGERWIAFASVGVPHLVIRVDDIEAIELLRRGRSLRNDPRLGAAGANVNFVAPEAVKDGRWLIRTYERGVEAETLACGTGTVAAGVALASRGEAELPVGFRSRGGEALEVRAALSGRQASDVWLGGQGKLVFRGVWEG